MRIATVDESRKIDERAAEQYDLSSELLMEAAGSLAAREIEQSFFSELFMHSTGVICGPGLNGADGLVVARHLHAKGHLGLTIFLAAPKEKRDPLFETQLQRCKMAGIEIVDLLKQKKMTREKLRSSRLKIDALFGIGLSRKLSEPYVSIVGDINALIAETKSSIVSIDVPSGLDADRGVVLGAAVRATLTTTFGLPKRGFFVSEGPQYVGRLRVLSIGLPKSLISKTANTHVAITSQMTRALLPRRSTTANKSDSGKAAIIGGSDGMWGAALLSAGSAARVGAGYVTLASHGDVDRVISEMPEILTARIQNEDFWSRKKWQVAAIGPGLGTGSEAKKALHRLLKLKVTQVVVDADALTVLANEKIFKLPKDWILTPHSGELSRLLSSKSNAVKASQIDNDRFRFARDAADLFGCTVLLKGFRTIVAAPEKTYVILAGNSALAKAGMGDVLTGMIVGFMAQGLATPRAAVLAAYLHGRIADEWIRSGRDRLSLQPSDVREILPSLIARLRSGAEP